MSLDLPASVERDLERYAHAENISPTEAAANLIHEALNAKSRRVAKHPHQPVDWDKFQQLVPGLELFQRLPEGTVDAIAKSSRRIRSQKLTPRA